MVSLFRIKFRVARFASQAEAWWDNEKNIGGC